MFLDNNNKSNFNMYRNSFRGADGSCQKSIKRSAFNRWVRFMHTHLYFMAN